MYAAGQKVSWELQPDEEFEYLRAVNSSGLATTGLALIRRVSDGNTFYANEDRIRIISGLIFRVWTIPVPDEGFIVTVSAADYDVESLVMRAHKAWASYKDGLDVDADLLSAVDGTVRAFLDDAYDFAEWRDVPGIFSPFAVATWRED